MSPMKLLAEGPVSSGRPQLKGSRIKVGGIEGVVHTEDNQGVVVKTDTNGLDVDFKYPFNYELITDPPKE